jgi:hypothetical protein
VANSINTHKMQHKKQKREHQQQQQQPPPSAGAAAAVAAAAAAPSEYKSLGLRLHAASPFISYVFLKRHTAAAAAHEGDAPAANASTATTALYVTGLPLGLDEGSLASIFGLFGGVTDVVMHPSKVCGRGAAAAAALDGRAAAARGACSPPVCFTTVCTTVRSAPQRWSTTPVAACQRR